MYNKEIQITAEKLNDQTLFSFIDIFSFDIKNMVFTDEVKKMGVTSYDEFVKFLTNKTEKYWNDNPEKTQALKILRNSEYKAGKSATVAHHLDWKSAFYDASRGVVSFKANFDYYPALPEHGLDVRGYVVRDFGADMVIHCADMRFEGVKNLKIVRRVFNWDNFKEVKAKETSWEAIQDIFLRKKYVYVPNIKETEDGVVMTFEVKTYRKKCEITFLELTFEYDKSSSSLEIGKDKRFLHWERNFLNVFPKYFNWNNQKFKKRKHSAQKKMKTYKMLKEDGLLN